MTWLIMKNVNSCVGSISPLLAFLSASLSAGAPDRRHSPPRLFAAVAAHAAGAARSLDAVALAALATAFAQAPTTRDLSRLPEFTRA